MNFEFLFILSKDKPLWVDFIQMAIPLLVFIWGFSRAFKAWERQKKREIELGLEQKRYESKIEACKAMWSLLVFMSLRDNDKTIFIEQDQQYLFRKPQAEEFIKKLPEVFFEKGHGIFMSAETRDYLYHFRSIVHKMLTYISNKHPGEDVMPVNNPELKPEINELFKKLNASIRKDLLENKISFKD